MTTQKFILFCLLLTVYSCGQAPGKHNINPESVRLNNKIIPLVSYTNNPDSCRKALIFLDSATVIDSNDFTAYNNKLMFLGSLKEYTKAIKTVDELIRLRPNAHDLYMQKGNFLEIIGDTTSAKLNFEKSLSICNSVLDTMLETNRDYRMLVTNKAINLIMLGDSAMANKILKVLYENQSGDSALENIEKEYISSLMHKNRIELMNSFFKPDSTGTGSYPK